MEKEVIEDNYILDTGQGHNEGMGEEVEDIEDKDVKFKDIKIQGQCIKRMAEKDKSVKDKDMYNIYCMNKQYKTRTFKPKY